MGCLLLFLTVLVVVKQYLATERLPCFCMSIPDQTLTTSHQSLIPPHFPPTHPTHPYVMPEVHLIEMSTLWPEPTPYCRPRPSCCGHQQPWCHQYIYLDSGTLPKWVTFSSKWVQIFQNFTFRKQTFSCLGNTLYISPSPTSQNVLFNNYNNVFTCFKSISIHN